MCTLNRSEIEISTGNSREIYAKKTAMSNGELITAKYILPSFVYIFYTYNSCTLRCYCRSVEPGG